MPSGQILSENELAAERASSHFSRARGPNMKFLKHLDGQAEIGALERRASARHF